MGGWAGVGERCTLYFLAWLGRDEFNIQKVTIGRQGRPGRQAIWNEKYEPLKAFMFHFMFHPSFSPI